MLSFAGPSKVDPLLPKVVAAYDRLNDKNLHLYLSDIITARDMVKLGAFAHKRSDTTVTYLNPGEGSVDPAAYKHNAEAIVLFFDVKSEKLYANGVEVSKASTKNAGPVFAPATFISAVGDTLESIREEEGSDSDSDPEA